jgi:3-(3-hydroxy-phenyl)propionate hydroxylase
MPRRDPVIIVGGGPVGLVVALILGRAGVPVTLFERANLTHQEPRAATIHAATLDQLDDLGVYEKIEPQGLVCPIVNFYEGPERTLIASFDHALLAGEVRHPWVLQCEQDKVARTLAEMVAVCPSVTVRTETEVLGFTQGDEGVAVTVRVPGGGEEEHKGSYLVGTDGARSVIRRLLGVAFEGLTYPERFAIIGTTYDFTRDGYANRNYISDPEEWYNLFRISWRGPPGVFRLIVPVSPDDVGLSEEQWQALGQRKLNRFHPRSEPYEIVIHDSYVVNQRVASSFREGRVMLAGDSAHLNSPIGGMGMNSGIHDAVSLGNNLLRVWQGESEEWLDLYARQRRFVATEYVQKATLINKKNMEQRDPESRRLYREDMGRKAADPVLAKEYLMNSSLITSLRDAAAVR